MPQIGDGFVVVDKTEKENVIKTRQMDVGTKNAKAGQNNVIDLPKEEEKNEPLMEDGNIISLSEQAQGNRTAFSRDVFVRDVKKLNEKTRGVDPERMAEKGDLVLSLWALESIKVKDAKGKDKKLPSDIREVLGLVNDYTLLSCTARENANQRGYGVLGVLWWAAKVAFNFSGNRSKITKEHELIAKINRKLNTVIPKYENADGYGDVVRKLKGLRTKLTIQSGAVRTVNNTHDGRCKRKWKSYTPENHKINGVGRNIQTTADMGDSGMKWVIEKDVVKDRKDWPLFAHRPSYEDICQGAAGNCFFLAALASIPGDKIREMMLDHGDGTVTVRFYEKNQITGKREPVYVTVDKKVKINASLDCFWVQIMEKAYSLFRQTRSNNKMILENVVTVNPMTGEEEATEKTISENVIDLGYLANGGQSRDVLSDFLGVESEFVDVYEAVDHKTLPQICRDALQQSDEQGAAVLEIQRLQKRFGRMTKRIEKLMNKRGKTLDDFRDYEAVVRLKKESIAQLEDAIKHTEDPEAIRGYRQKINNHIAELKENEDEIAPIKGLVYEYLNAKKQTESQIQAIMKKHGIKANKNDGPHKVEYNAYGIQEELGVACKKSMEYLDKIGFFNNIPADRLDEIREGNETAVKYVLSGFIDEYIEKVASKRGISVLTANVKDYELLIRDALNGVKENSKLFINLASDSIGLGATLNGNQKLGLELTKEFMIPVLEKMLKNIWYVDGIERSLDYGDEDPLAIHYFNKLTTMIKNHQCVCIGTREVSGSGGGVAGEGLDKGMVGGHAYTVMDTKKTKNGARLVKLRNTWAGYVVDYKQNKKGVLESFAVEKENSGIFWIEMNHLMKYLDDIHGSGMPEVA